MRSDRNYLRSIVTKTLAVLVFFTALVFVRNVSPTDVFAQQTQNNTSVFSGQVIPAFIGTAYDPSYAYQRLAGLPIYVFAYDSWGGTGFVINNLAVRTQIRIDGTFQAQGLPNAANYGVYFPFALGGSGIVSTDCDPCAYQKPELSSIAFRMPQLNNLDGIQDVFSYNLGDANGISVQDQTGQPITLGLSFLTQETKVDVANNTNTFPLVPTSTLRINAKPLLQFNDPYPGSGAPSTTEYSDDAFEVVAQRVVTRGVAATTTGGGLFNQPTNVPYIRGRTTFPLQAVESTTDRTLNNTSFSAFAPEGIYAISVWRSEGGTNYRNYQPNTTGGDTASLESSLVGFAIVRVDSSSGVSLIGDWSLVNGVGSDDTNYIPLRSNKFIIWGRVIRQNGTMAVGSFSSWADGADVYLYNPQQDGTTSAHHDPKMRNHGCGDHFWTYPLSGFSQCGDDPTRDLPDNFMNSYGIYAFYEINSALLEGLTPRNGDFEVFVSTTDDPNQSTTQSEKEPTGNIFTTDGPVQVDLLLAEEVPNVFFEMIVDLSTFNFTPQGEDVNLLSPESIDVDIRVADPEDLQNITDGAVDIVGTETHHPDSAGRVKIPLTDFIPDIEYQYVVTFAGAEVAQGTFVPASSPQITVQLTNSDWTPFATASKQKVFGILPASWFFPDAPQTYASALECGPSSGTAQLTLEFARADVYQSVRILQGGEPWIRWTEEFLAEKQGKWSTYYCLPYTDPEYTCGSLQSVTEGNLYGYGLCLAKASEQNEFEIVATGNGQTLSERVTVAFEPVGIAGARPIVEPGKVTFEFNNMCEDMSVDLLNNFYINEAKDEEDDGIFNISQGFRKFTQVHIPVVGCTMGRALAPRLESGLLQFKNQLILEPLNTQPAVSAAWNAIRQVSNFFFVFILLIIAINYILGVDRKTWNLNTLLPQLILGIVLANTSLLIVQAIMDLNNILTQWLFSITFEVLSGTGLAEGGLGAAAGIGGIAAIASLIGTLLSGGIASALAAVATTGGTAAVPLVGLVLTGIGALAGFLVTLLAILYGRVLIIWIITIVGPLMFALSTLPWTGSLKGLWWKTLIPIAFMQTVIAMLMSVGVILMSVPNEGGSLFASAGVFLTGLVTMISMIKSPQLSMQLMGGGGLAGQAFGAVSGVASRLGGAAGGLATGALGGVAGGLVGGLTPEDRAERQKRDDMLKVVRPELYEGGRIGKTIRRIGAGGRNYQFSKLNKEAQLIKEQGTRDKNRESAEKTAITMNKLEKGYDEGKIRGRVPAVIAGRLPGSQRSRLERKSEATKLPEQQMRVSLGLEEFDADAFSAVANEHWYDTSTKYSVKDSSGKVKALDIPSIYRDVVASSTGLTAAQRKKALEARSIDMITHSEKGLGSDGYQLKKELLARLNESAKENYFVSGAKTGVEMKQEGIRARGRYKQAKGVDIPDSSGGGDKK